MSKEVKQESSIPIQTRVSFMSLAKLHIYWTLEGYNVRTMSQLGSWSIDLLCEVLEANGKMPAQLETLAEAHQYLQRHGLYQGSLQGRAMKKIGTALRFETLREQGRDPKYNTPRQHEMLHKESSVQPFEGTVETGVVVDGGMSDEEWNRIQERIEEEKRKEIDAAVKKAKAAGLIVSEPEVEEPEKLCQEEARAKYFKQQAELKKERGETINEVKNSNELDKGVSVKQGMDEEGYRNKLEEIAKRDKARLELENAPFEPSDLNIVGGDSDVED